jgi:hypothetical protein
MAIMRKKAEPTRAFRHGVFLCLTAWLCIAGLPPAFGQEPECDVPPPANACPPGGGPFSCPNPTSLTCDLGMQYSFSPADGYSSVDLRIGDPVDAPGAETPRVIWNGVNRFYTKIYSRISNLGGVSALAAPWPAGCVGAPAATPPVTVTFSFKETEDPTDIAGPWTPIPGGIALGNTYTMNIPAPAPHGALLPTTPSNPGHSQQKAICWRSNVGQELPRRFMLRAELDWGGMPESDATNNVAYSYYDLTAEKPAADIGFALDLSGSMGWSMPTMAGFTRLQVAQDRAKQFVDLIEAGDRLGIFGFATNNPGNTNFLGSYVDTGGIPRAGNFADTSEIFAAADIVGTPSDLPADTNRDEAKNAIDAQGDWGCTPVGQGLLRAKANFAAAGDRTKSIVLFSDGMQNVRPYVNTTPPETCGAPGLPWPNISAADTFADEDIRIYSVFFGDQVWAWALMQQIRAQTGGDYVFGAATDIQLAAVYYSIRNLLDDLLYLEEEGRTAGFGPGAPFTVHYDSTPGTSTIGIAWPLDADARLTVERRRQGEVEWVRFDEPVPAAGTNVAGGAYRVYRFEPGPNTTWELRVVQLRPRAGAVDYALAVYSQTEGVRLDAGLEAETFAAGDPLPIHARLHRGSHPVPGAAVTAAVRLPDRQVSTLLRRYAGRFDLSAQADDLIPSLARQFRQFLARDNEPADPYAYRQVAVTLADDGQGADRRAGDGIYSGTLSAQDTRVAGDYQVTVTATGTTLDGRPFERVEKLGTLAAVGPADPERSEIRIDVGASDDGSRTATVTVLPTDRHGNAAFPGSGGAIAVRPRPGGGTLAGGVVDNLDSSFTQTLTLGPGQTLAADVVVGGVTIGEAVEDGGAGPAYPRREASFHLGLAEPHGRFARAFDGGPSFGLDWTYRLDRNLGLRADLGYSLFDDPSGGDLGLFHAIPYLQYRRPGVVWEPYFEVGYGYYDLESAGAAGGFAAGIGAHRVLSNRWRLDFSLHSHRVGGGLDLGFSQLGFGVLYTY